MYLYLASATRSMNVLCVHHAAGRAILPGSELLSFQYYAVTRLTNKLSQLMASPAILLALPAGLVILARQTIFLPYKDGACESSLLRVLA